MQKCALDQALGDVRASIAFGRNTAIETTRNRNEQTNTSMHWQERATLLRIQIWLRASSGISPSGGCVWYDDAPLAKKNIEENSKTLKRIMMPQEWDWYPIHQKLTMSY